MAFCGNRPQASIWPPEGAQTTEVNTDLSDSNAMDTIMALSYSTGSRCQVASHPIPQTSTRPQAAAQTPDPNMASSGGNMDHVTILRRPSPENELVSDIQTLLRAR